MYKIIGIVVALILAGGAIYYFSSASNSSAVPNSATAATENTPVPQAGAQQETKATTGVATQASQTPQAAPVSSQLVPGEVMATVVDQFGNPYSTNNVGTQVPITDADGQTVGYAQLNGTKLQSGKLPAGTYTMELPGQNGIAEGYTPLEEKFQLPAQGVNLGKLTFTLWPKVTIHITDSVGTPISFGNVEVKECDVSDPWVAEQDAKLQGASFCAMLAASGEFQNGTYWDNFPAGSYDLEFQAGGFTSVDKSFTVGSENLDLGKIVMQSAGN